MLLKIEPRVQDAYPYAIAAESQLVQDCALDTGQLLE